MVANPAGTKLMIMSFFSGDGSYTNSHPYFIRVD